MVAEFESDRAEQIATDGITPTAAYDAGLRHAVHDAIADIDLGRYGLCQNCRSLIDTDRLLSTPYARRCESCQRRQESSWTPLERMVASVVRASVGEPQGPPTVERSSAPTGHSHRGDR